MREYIILSHLCSIHVCYRRKRRVVVGFVDSGDYQDAVDVRYPEALPIGNHNWTLWAWVFVKLHTCSCFGALAGTGVLVGSRAHVGSGFLVGTGVRVELGALAGSGVLVELDALVVSSLKSPEVLNNLFHILPNALSNSLPDFVASFVP